MPPHASIPRELRLLPFRGSDAVSRKLLTATALRGKAWARLLPDIYIAADVPLGPADVVVGPVRFSTPVRTAFDLSRRLPLTDAIITIDAMLAKRLLTVDVLGEYCGARRRWPGGAAIPLVLDRIEPLTESPMETRLRLILVDGGLPRPTAQFRARRSRVTVHGCIGADSEPRYTLEGSVAIFDG